MENNGLGNALMPVKHQAISWVENDQKCEKLITSAHCLKQLDLNWHQSC